MKPLILTLFSLALYFNVSAQAPSTCVPSVVLSNLYKTDVSYLAMGRMDSLQSADTSLIEIPQTWKDTIMEGLAAIDNIDSLVQGDSIFRYYCVHESEISNSILAYVDTSFGWTHAWAALHTVTGNAPLDDFMNLHRFSVTDFYTYSWGIFAVLTPDHFVNLRRFEDSLLLFPGIMSAQLNQTFGDGNHIAYERDSVRNYTFTVGWGDCPSGCTSRKIWKYKVDDLCNVTLLSVNQFVSNPFPNRPNCYRTLGIGPVGRNLNVTLYPNPAETEIYLSLNGNPGLCQYVITDIYGRITGSGVFSADIEIGIRALSAGVYFIGVADGSGNIWRQKFVKR